MLDKTSAASHQDPGGHDRGSQPSRRAASHAAHASCSPGIAAGRKGGRPMQMANWTETCSFVTTSACRLADTACCVSVKGLWPAPVQPSVQHAAPGAAAQRAKHAQHWSGQLGPCTGWRYSSPFPAQRSTAQQGHCDAGKCPAFELHREGQPYAMLATLGHAVHANRACRSAFDTSSSNLDSSELAGSSQRQCTSIPSSGGSSSTGGGRADEAQATYVTANGTASMCQGNANDISSGSNTGPSSAGIRSLRNSGAADTGRDAQENNDADDPGSSSADPDSGPLAVATGIQVEFTMDNTPRPGVVPAISVGHVYMVSPAASLRLAFDVGDDTPTSALMPRVLRRPLSLAVASLDYLFSTHGKLPLFTTKAAAEKHGAKMAVDRVAALHERYEASNQAGSRSGSSWGSAAGTGSSSPVAGFFRAQLQKKRAVTEDQDQDQDQPRGQLGKAKQVPRTTAGQSAPSSAPISDAGASGSGRDLPEGVACADAGPVQPPSAPEHGAGEDQKQRARGGQALVRLEEARRQQAQRAGAQHAGVSSLPVPAQQQQQQAQQGNRQTNQQATEPNKGAPGPDAGRGPAQGPVPPRWHSWGPFGWLARRGADVQAGLKRARGVGRSADRNAARSATQQPGGWSRPVALAEALTQLQGSPSYANPPITLMSDDEQIQQAMRLSTGNQARRSSGRKRRSSSHQVQPPSVGPACSAGESAYEGTVPVFSIPGITLTLLTTLGPVEFRPLFLSKDQLDLAVVAVRKLVQHGYLARRRLDRLNRRRMVERSAAAMAGFGGGLPGGGPASLAEDDDLEAEEPPEVRQFMEELGAPEAAAGGSLPGPRGLLGFLGATACGCVSAAAALAQGVGDVADAAVCHSQLGRRLLRLDMAPIVHAHPLRDVIDATRERNAAHLAAHPELLEDSGPADEPPADQPEPEAGTAPDTAVKDSEQQTGGGAPADESSFVRPEGSSSCSGKAGWGPSSAAAPGVAAGAHAEHAEQPSTQSRPAAAASGVQPGFTAGSTGSRDKPSSGCCGGNSKRFDEQKSTDSSSRSGAEPAHEAGPMSRATAAAAVSAPCRTQQAEAQRSAAAAAAGLAQAGCQHIAQPHVRAASSAEAQAGASERQPDTGAPQVPGAALDSARGSAAQHSAVAPGARSRRQQSGASSSIPSSPDEQGASAAAPSAVSEASAGSTSAGIGPPLSPRPQLQDSRPSGSPPIPNPEPASAASTPARHHGSDPDTAFPAAGSRVEAAASSSRGAQDANPKHSQSPVPDVGAVDAAGLPSGTPQVPALPPSGLPQVPAPPDGNSPLSRSEQWRRVMRSILEQQRRQAAAEAQQAQQAQVDWPAFNSSLVEGVHMGMQQVFTHLLAAQIGLTLGPEQGFHVQEWRPQAGKADAADNGRDEPPAENRLNLDLRQVFGHPSALVGASQGSREALQGMVLVGDVSSTMRLPGSTTLPYAFPPVGFGNIAGLSSKRP